MKPCKTLNESTKQTVQENAKILIKHEEESEDEEVKQQYREVSRARETFWIDDLRDDDVVKFETTATAWKAGKIFSERELRSYRIPEASALCVATQVEGPNRGSKAMLRIREQIPSDGSDSDETGSLELGDYAEMELNYLLHVTKHGSTCTPKLIDYAIESQGETDSVPGGFRLYILMEKIPGRNLVNFGELEMTERDQVRIAFARAIYEFYTLGLAHEDPHRRNLMWDRKNKKVYIIDLESATHSKLYVFQPSLVREFYYWGLAGVSMDTESGGVDPMIPRRNAFDESDYPSEELLTKMAAAAVGKPIRYSKVY